MLYNDIPFSQTLGWKKGEVQNSERARREKRIEIHYVANFVRGRKRMRRAQIFFFTHREATGIYQPRRRRLHCCLDSDTLPVSNRYQFSSLMEKNGTREIVI